MQISGIYAVLGWSARYLTPSHCWSIMVHVSLVGSRNESPGFRHGAEARRCSRLRLTAQVLLLPCAPKHYRHLHVLPAPGDTKWVRTCLQRSPKIIMTFLCHGTWSLLIIKPYLLLSQKVGAWCKRADTRPILAAWLGLTCVSWICWMHFRGWSMSICSVCSLSSSC